MVSGCVSKIAAMLLDSEEGIVLFQYHRLLVSIIVYRSSEIVNEMLSNCANLKKNCIKE